MTLDFDILLTIGIFLFLELTWDVTLPHALHKIFIQYDIVFLFQYISVLKSYILFLNQISLI